MKYEFAEDIQRKAEKIARVLFPHVKLGYFKSIRSYGSKSNAIARCHALGKVMQKAMGVKAFYALEFIAERFDKMSEENQVKTIIHELMHIPKSFGGGFKHHDYVTERNVNKLYQEYRKHEFQSNF